MKSAAAIDSTKPWTWSAKQAEYFEPDDHKFPHLRSSLDRDDASVTELNAVFARNNVTNLKELVEDYTSLLSAGCGANQADPVWELETDIRRVQALTLKRVRASSTAITRSKWAKHLAHMATALGSHAADQGQHLSNLRGFQGSAMILAQWSNTARYGRTRTRIKAPCGAWGTCMAKRRP